MLENKMVLCRSSIYCISCSMHIIHTVENYILEKINLSPVTFQIFYCFVEHDFIKNIVMLVNLLYYTAILKEIILFVDYGSLV